MKEELRKKIRDVQDIEISEETIGKVIKRRKNWTSPGIEEIQISGGRTLVEPGRLYK